MISRQKRTELEYYLSFSPAIGILGTRQIGKTTLAKEINDLIDKPTLYLDLESPEDLQKLEFPEDYFKQNIDKCIIIDEIQIRPELFGIIRHLIDKKREPARFVVLGSASPTLIKSTSESLTGRIIYIELAGLNLSEIGYEHMYPNWFKGGYPEAYLTDNLDQSKIWLDSFIDNYIKRELPQLGLTTSAENIRRFWRMIAHSNGGLWNTSSYARALKLNNKTIDVYRDFLEGAFLINVLESYYVNIKKRMVKSPKVYIRDTGVLHRLLRISDLDELYSMTHIGNSWEGYVYEQIRQLKNKEIDLYFFKTHNGAEIDLVFSKSDQVISTAEIKLTNAPKTSKGLSESIKSLKSKHNYIITPSSDNYTKGNDIRICSLRTFLKEYLPEIK